MNIEYKLLEFIEEELTKIDLDMLWDQVSMSLLVDKWMLLLASECLFYKQLIIKKTRNEQLESYICLLKDPEAKISQLSYLFLIYEIEKIMKRKCDSPNNLYI